MEGKLQKYHHDSERLNMNLKNTTQQLDDERNKNQKYESQLRDFRDSDFKLKESNQRIIILTQEVENLKNLMVGKNKNIEELEKERLDTFQKMNQYKEYERKNK